MKKIFVVALTMGLMMAACGGKSNSKIDTDLISNPHTADGIDPNVQVAVLAFDSEMHDFGFLSEGENIAYSFHFVNKGNADLIINGCKASCGCTVADYPHGRIAPGEDGYITVTFNSSGKSGTQYQEVTVTSNAQPGRVKLKIAAMVR